MKYVGIGANTTIKPIDPKDQRITELEARVKELEGVIKSSKAFDEDYCAKVVYERDQLKVDWQSDITARKLKYAELRGLFDNQGAAVVRLSNENDQLLSQIEKHKEFTREMQRLNESTEAELRKERDQLRAQRDHLEKIHENQVRAAALSSKAFDQLRADVASKDQSLAILRKEYESKVNEASESEAELARAREFIQKLASENFDWRYHDEEAQAFLKSTEKEIG